MITLRQACVLLDIRSYRTLQKWLKRLSIEPVRQHYAFDHRLSAITDEHVAIIRAAREELADTAPHRAIRPERPVSAPQEHSARVVRVLSDKPRLPDGWISYNKWLLTHGINRRAFEQAIGQGRVGGPEHGEWWERPQGPTLSAFTPEQHVAASRYAARRWGERFTPCAQCQDLSR